MSVHNKYETMQVVDNAVKKVDKLKEYLNKFRIAIENNSKLDELADEIDNTLSNIDEILGELVWVTDEDFERICGILIDTYE